MRWQNWSFVIGFNAREGLTLHHLRYDDEGRTARSSTARRSPRWSCPTATPAPRSARKNAFDVGEYGMGMCANSLELGCDCLGLIHYFDAHLCTSRGEPLTIKNAICMHEEDFGILWKHTDRRLPDAPEVRRSRRLVISSVSTVENYEYGFFWYLYQDGNIQLEIKLTGILSLGALQPGEKPKYGSAGRAAALRPEPSALLQRAARLRPRRRRPTRSSRSTSWPTSSATTTRSRTPSAPGRRRSKTEKQARGAPEPRDGADVEDRQPGGHERRRRAGRLQVPAGRQRVPVRLAERLVAEAGRLRQPPRLGHAVSPRARSTRAGDYPNQSRGGDGLIRWTEQDRPIENTDVVLWYTFGHTHIPRPEDYPVMPTAYIGFLLKPHGLLRR